jgi:hypothetical protein
LRNACFSPNLSKLIVGALLLVAAFSPSDSGSDVNTKSFASVVDLLEGDQHHELVLLTPLEKQQLEGDRDKRIVEEDANNNNANNTSSLVDEIGLDAKGVLLEDSREDDHITVNLGSHSSQWAFLLDNINDTSSARFGSFILIIECLLE